MKVYHSFEPYNKSFFGKHGEMLTPVFDQLAYQTLEAYKYKVMWCLRDIEDEITSAGGSIVIKMENEVVCFDCLDFQPQLLFSIMERLKTLKAEDPFCILDNYVLLIKKIPFHLKLWRGAYIRYVNLIVFFKQRKRL